MATIYDIAREANVSIASVSLVFNDPETKRVGKETRTRIQRVAKAMGYHPNAAAKALTEGKTRIIGLVIPMREPIFINPFIAEVLAGVQSSLMEHGYHLMIYSHQAATGRLTSMELNQSRQVDGVIIVNTRMCTQADMEDTIRDLKRSKIPFVMVNGYRGRQKLNYVGVDDEEAGFTAADYLLRKGHRRIAIICGQTGSPISDSLTTGFARAHAKNGVPLQPALQYDSNYDFSLTRQRLEEWFSSRQRPTAIFAADDHLLNTVFASIRSFGLNIPTDVAVLSRGSAAVAVSLTPTVTMIAIPAMEIGKRAGKLLIDTLQDSSRPVEKIILPGMIEPGESA
ncbi:transcriptional regulator, LacI family [Granulicella rosea]|uniref:Transcriptional regulator, LacI family n=1 Tax=Granulicella rosea TaxID=474952 RepID=A0A239ENB9_9BACT|nr:LacI family DNA-binding transcriptional regulator [Granulicella rosea]SNS46156.1 transcriptional regulator, LacI family [Granulicella rosea]